MSDLDEQVVSIISALEIQNIAIKALRDLPECRLDKRALSVALTELETAMLWIANARP